MFDDFVRDLVLPLGFGVIAYAILARWVIGLVDHWRLNRAMELRMEERLALVSRGLHPQTLAPLSPPPDENAGH